MKKRLSILKWIFTLIIYININIYIYIYIYTKAIVVLSSMQPLPPYLS
ncbi:MAG: hypothetical protein MCS20_01910 [Candidatus Phytoplasma mali]|nr:hypothetical protein [Candidatus Phytoplasma mali]